MNRFSGMLQAFAGMLVLLALDQFSKIWVRETIPLYEMTPLVPNFLDLTHVQNRGVIHGTDIHSYNRRCARLSNIRRSAIVLDFDRNFPLRVNSMVRVSQPLIRIVTGARIMEVV